LFDLGLERSTAQMMMIRDVQFLSGSDDGRHRMGFQESGLIFGRQSGQALPLDFNLKKSDGKLSGTECLDQ
jgi:hypothetical protein